MENVYYHVSQNVDIDTICKRILGGLNEYDELIVRTPHYLEWLNISKAAFVLHGFFKDVRNEKLCFVPEFEFASPENGNITHFVFRFVLEKK